MKTLATITCALVASLHFAGAAPASQAAPEPDTATAAPVSVSYDSKYDVEDSSLSTVACSDGQNGLIRKGYSTFGSLPAFPLLGGAPTIPGWNSPNCGRCYQLHYQDGNVDQKINIIAIDVARGGFNIGFQAMNQLTKGQAVDLGHVNATYMQVADSVCGM